MTMVNNGYGGSLYQELLSKVGNKCVVFKMRKPGATDTTSNPPFELGQEVELTIIWRKGQSNLENR